MPSASSASLRFPQRFGSSLNPHYHYHVLALDGVVFGDVEHGVRFHEATGLEARDAEALARTVQLRILRWFARRGLLDPSTVADMHTWQGTGGFSVDASVRIEGEDRAGLERLVRYCARGPLALERLHAPAGLGALTSPDARLVYRLTEPDMHGRHEPYEVPAGVESRSPPGLASHPVPPTRRAHEPEPSGSVAAPPRSRPSRMLRAQLLARIYEVPPLLCPACGGAMKIISFITLPSTVQDILLHLDLPHRPPRVSPARGPPQAELHFDQTQAFELAAPEPIPEYEFDQSAPEDWQA